MIAPTDAVKQIADWLSQRSQTVNHRQLLLLCGEQSWSETIAEECWRVSSTLSNTILVGLWLGERSCNGQHEPLTNAKAWLGQELDLVIYNAHTRFDIDGLLAICGTLRHHGLIVLLCPPRDTWSTGLNCMQHPSLGTKVKHSYFGQWFNAVIESQPNVAWVEQQTLQVKLPQSPVAPSDIVQFDVAAPFKTQDQCNVAKKVLQQLTSTHKQCAVITAPRGRGKSWLAGWLIQQFNQNQQPVLLISSRATAVQTIFKQTDQNNSAKLLQFAAPDTDISDLSVYNLVVIDEAASIPAPMLERICQAASTCVLTTTTDGYEGTGQGFLQRLLPAIQPFYQQLNQYQLEQPIRWYRNDSLENLLAHLSCKSMPLATEHSNVQETQAFTCNLIEPAALVQSPQMLQALFTLLRDAHYQTTIADLVRLLDSPDHVIFIAQKNATLLGACVVIKEGNSQLADLASPIARGQRRPQGHLSLQLMAFHTTQLEYCHLSAWRVNRIVVADEYRQQGIASALLDFAEQSAISNHVDIMTTIFGEKALLKKFWVKNGYSKFYTGSRPNKASNSLNLLYTKVLNPTVNQWFSQGGSLTEDQQKQKLRDFIAGWRGVASIQEALIACSYIAANNENLPILSHIAVQQRCDLQELISRFAPGGKKQFADNLRSELQIVLPTDCER